MTGEAFGKIEVPNSAITLCDKNNDCLDLDDFVVYVHVKGYAEAKITHLDIEGADYARIEEEFLGEHERTTVKLYYADGVLYVSSPKASMMIVLDIPSEEDVSCYGTMGLKEGGVFIGLCRKLIEVFEPWGKERLEAGEAGGSE